MARTYYAEGRQIAYWSIIFLFTDLKQIWWMFFVIIISSILLAEIFGSRWTKKRRADKKAYYQIERINGSGDHDFIIL
ncbi:hypothetical protein SAMN04487897_11734 [Paenibacillus sp. yr247]|uniref:hypothetical protein n=1 Tax=Paenibacillus sp. yr247 TaxID=1761880 RepID=UPI00088AABBC|nr:hypothetical protein [Paenibacillus sp. yr247]SDO57882.1 hypothetical protein SAMN04487897_11734 [Paenibacillus sp. yr247]